MALGLSPSEIVDKGEYPLLVKARHWLRVPLSEVAAVQNGFAFKSEFFNRDSGMPLIRIRDVTKSDPEHKYNGDYEPEFIVKRGDILIGMDGDFYAAIWDGPAGLLNQRVCRLEVINKNYDRKFFFLCLQPYLNAINAETSSVTVKHLSSRTIQDIPLPLPPLNEQKRIVAKTEELFSELDKSIENLRTAQQQLKIYRQAVLKHAFEGKLTADWREKNKNKLETADQLLARIKRERDAEAKILGKKTLKETRPLADEDFSWLSSLAAEWFWDRLGWMTCGIEYGSGAKSSETGDVPVLRMGNIQNMKLDWDDLVYTSDKNEISDYLLKAGDVLFNRTNSPEWVGKTALYKGERPAIFAGYLMRVNQIDSIVDARFLNFYLNSHTAKQYGNKVKTDGVNQSNINGEKLAHYPFPYCSLEEQRVIVDLLEESLSSIDRTEADIDFQLQKSETLRQSILKRAFSGRLVAQDPKDEPASILLERIRAKKNGAERSKNAA